MSKPNKIRCERKKKDKIEMVGFAKKMWFYNIVIGNIKAVGSHTYDLSFLSFCFSSFNTVAHKILCEREEKKKKGKEKKKL